MSYLCQVGCKTLSQSINPSVYKGTSSMMNIRARLGIVGKAVSVFQVHMVKTLYQQYYLVLPLHFIHIIDNSVKHKNRQNKSVTFCTFSIGGVDAKYWEFHGLTTCATRNWWEGLEWNLCLIVKAWRMRLAGHVLRQTEDRPTNVDINWTLEDARDQEEDHKRLGVWHSQIYKVLEWHGEVQRESPMTIRDGGISSPDVPMGAGGTKLS